MKRRSATSSPPEPVFFTDENLGRHKLPEALRRAGLRVEIHGDHFPQGTPDEGWLPVVAAKGWVLLTLDAKLRYNRLERDAILVHRLAAFLLVGGRTHEEKADAVLRGRARILRLLRRQRRPFIAKVYADGSVTLWLDGSSP